MAEGKSMKQRNQNLWRTFTTSAWLGWKIGSNWTDPFLFALYSVIKPIAAASILVVMYRVVSANDFTSPIFAYLYFGNAFYQYVGAIMYGMSWTIIDDREHYQTLKYVFIAPIQPSLYLIGRAVERFGTTTIAILITLAFGILFLNVPFDFSAVNWPLFVLALLLGILLLISMGLILAGIALNTARHSEALGEIVAGGLFLFSGAIFPLSVLPVYLRWLGYVVPISYWLELVRRAIIVDVAQAYPTFSQLTNGQLMAILAGMTLVFSVLAIFLFSHFNQRARKNGLIDQTTNY